MTFEDMVAHIEIQQALVRYCRGVDRGDIAMISSVYHPGAVDYHGAWTGEGKDFGPYLVPMMDATPLIGQHHITNTMIEVDGEKANCESYFIAFHPERPDVAGPGRHILVCGRYLDRFELRDGAWKIAERRVVLDIGRPLAATESWSAMAHYPNGARREDDPSADHLARQY